MPHSLARTFALLCVCALLLTSIPAPLFAQHPGMGPTSDDTSVGGSGQSVPDDGSRPTNNSGSSNTNDIGESPSYGDVQDFATGGSSGSSDDDDDSGSSSGLGGYSPVPPAPSVQYEYQSNAANDARGNALTVGQSLKDVAVKLQTSETVLESATPAAESDVTPVSSDPGFSFDDVASFGSGNQDNDTGSDDETETNLITSPIPTQTEIRTLTPAEFDDANIEILNTVQTTPAVEMALGRTEIGEAPENLQRRAQRAGFNLDDPDAVVALALSHEIDARTRARIIKAYQEDPSFSTLSDADAKEFSGLMNAIANEAEARGRTFAEQVAVDSYLSSVTVDEEAFATFSNSETREALTALSDKATNGELATERGLDVAAPAATANHFVADYAYPTWRPNMTERILVGRNTQTELGIIRSEANPEADSVGNTLQENPNLLASNIFAVDTNGSLRTDVAVNQSGSTPNVLSFTDTSPHDPTSAEQAIESALSESSGDSEEEGTIGDVTPVTSQSDFSFDDVASFGSGESINTGAPIPADRIEEERTSIPSIQTDISNTNLILSYENAKDRNEDPDVSINGMTLPQFVQAELAQYNEEHGTNYQLDVYSGKGAHGTARHRAQNDHSEGIPGCACAIDVRILDEEGNWLSVSEHTDVYTSVGNSFVAHTGGSQGLGPEYMSHGMHLDVAHIVEPDEYYAKPGHQEWGSVGNGNASRLAELRRNAPEATVTRNGTQIEITLESQPFRVSTTEDGDDVAQSNPQTDAPYTPPEEIPGDEDSPSTNASSNDPLEWLAGFFGIEGGSSDDRPQPTTETPESLLRDDDSDDDESEDGDGQNDRNERNLGFSWIEDVERNDQLANDEERATTTATGTVVEEQRPLATVEQRPSVTARMTNAIRNVFRGIFGQETEGERYANLPSGQYTATSTPYVPIYVRVDETSGSVTFKRGETRNQDLNDSTEISATLEKSFEGPNDGPALAFNERGEIIYSDGRYAPPKAIDETTAEESEVEYVYLVERVRNGQVVAAEVNDDAVPGNIFTHTFSRIFGDDSPFRIEHVDAVTYEYVDPDTNESNNEYYDYTITLTDGSVRGVAIPVTTSLSYYREQFARIGYEGDVLALVKLGEQTGSRETERTPGFLEQLMSGASDTIQRAVDFFTPDSADDADTYTDLSGATADTDIEFGSFTNADVRSAFIYLNVPLECPDVPGFTEGYVYEIVVDLENQSKDGVIYGGMCGTGTSEVYASEVAKDLTRQGYFSEVDADTLLNTLRFRYYETSASETEVAQDVNQAPEAVYNPTNAITFEAKVSNADGSTAVDWTTNNITMQSSQSLDFRWNAETYQRCLPFIGDNGGYSIAQGNDLALTSGDTEAEGYDVIERSSVYRIECDGQAGEEGVDTREIEVNVQ